MFLVFKRRLDEDVIVNDGPSKVVVRVVEISGEWVKLGFDGDKGVPIDRSEVRASKDAERESLPPMDEDTKRQLIDNLRQVSRFTSLAKQIVPAGDGCNVLRRDLEDEIMRIDHIVHYLESK